MYVRDDVLRRWTRLLGVSGKNTKAQVREEILRMVPEGRFRTRPKIELPVDEIASSYKNGIPIEFLKQKYFVSESTIRDRLKRAGVDFGRNTIN